jgi:hypothetical protein
MIRKKQIWVAYCEGCLAEYGEPSVNKEAAEAFVREFPLCCNCDGENY